MTLRIAILGGTSHIARAVTPYLLEAGADVTLFARSPEKLADSLCKVKKGFDSFLQGGFDMVINCIGAGTPKELASDYNRWFSVLEQFDNLSLDYLKNRNPQALYIMFSSGAVYGRQSNAPVTAETVWQLAPNRISVPDYYAVSKLYSEAKHRSLPYLRIADLRIFSFFSRFSDLDSGYFMTDLVKALVKKETLLTTQGDMLRDFPHPGDLTALILRCAKEKQINTAVDAASREGISKKEILKSFSEKFGLKYRFSDTAPALSPNGYVNTYLPTADMAEKLLDWKAQKSSLETLISETEAILKHYGKA